MAAQYNEIQKLLRSRADLQARLNLMPYEGEDISIIAAFMKEHCWKTMQS